MSKLASIWSVWLGIMILDGQAIYRRDWLALSALALLMAGIWRMEPK
jgi:hypothetical protein